MWGTKGRRKILKPYVLLELKKSIYNTSKKYPTLWIESMNANDDHVHLQIEIPPNIAISDAVSVLKSASSFYLKKKFKFIREMYLDFELQNSHFSQFSYIITKGTLSALCYEYLYSDIQ